LEHLPVFGRRIAGAGFGLYLQVGVEAIGDVAQEQPGPLLAFLLGNYSPPLNQAFWSGRP
jgi:hypothetical protein